MWKEDQVEEQVKKGWPYVQDRLFTPRGALIYFGACYALVALGIVLMRWGG